MLRSMLLAIVGFLVSTSGAHGADYTAMSGKELYVRFCAACHGAEARGDGPVAGALAVEVPDLRSIARRNGGAFPRERIERIIDGRHILGAHGSRTMPVWGEDLSQLEIGSPDAEKVTRLVIERLVAHLESLQLPAAQKQ
jgi:mono/diheme cytochrome c family protein